MLFEVLEMAKKDTVLGDRLKELRRRKGLNQKHVATDIGISRARYSHYENNHVEPDTDMLKKLATYYNVTVDYLLGHEIKDINDMTEEEIDDEIKEIMKEVNIWYKDESKDKKEKLIMLRKIIKTFIED